MNESDANIRYLPRLIITATEDMLQLGLFRCPVRGNGWWTAADLEEWAQSRGLPIKFQRWGDKAAGQGEAGQP